MSVGQGFGHLNAQSGDIAAILLWIANILRGELRDRRRGGAAVNGFI
jgi:hypothetical protein